MEHQTEQPVRRLQAPAIVRRYNVERSCLRCHERKVRCDRALPCLKCVQAKASCRFPGPGRIKRRSQRPMAAPRLDMLERAAALNPGDSSEIPNRSFSGSTFPHEAASNIQIPVTGRAVPTEGVLVNEGTSSRYINELLFSRVLAEVRIPPPVPRYSILMLTRIA